MVTGFDPKRSCTYVNLCCEPLPSSEKLAEYHRLMTIGIV